MKRPDIDSVTQEICIGHLKQVFSLWLGTGDIVHCASYAWREVNAVAYEEEMGCVFHTLIRSKHTWTVLGCEVWTTQL